MSDDAVDRHSKAQTPAVATDPDELAALEARNGLKQFDVTLSLIDEYLGGKRPFKLRTSTLLHLHREALQGISAFAGNFRPAGVEIAGSSHQPVEAHLVPEYIEELCDYVNDNLKTASPIHLSAYVMWRLNWIHPFDDGNGRTSRALCYLVLCVSTGMQLPGSNTIPEQISNNKKPYYDALEAADAHYKKDKTINLSELEEYLESLLAKQLVDVFNSAKGNTENSLNSTPKFH
ncbi:Fic family protein [uncultured Sneathiella sp.]|uniref:Fic family protein n=1 Tax=uncultured Sneathiella sp. TaxID=879315 RepID=UPI0025931C60|nr:Fic family protein [uncultured Sneathiella sp.]